MIEEEFLVGDVFPDEEELVALCGSHHELFGKVAGDHTLLVVMDAFALGSPEDFPASLPG